MRKSAAERPTTSIVEAGRRYFDLGRDASYRAAKAGQIPCVRIGGRLFASVPAIERMLLEAGKPRKEQDA
jgi:hypothetical protein